MSTPSLLILPGDGIGPEVMAEVRKVISWFGEKRDLNFDVTEDLVGGIAYDTHGTPLTDATMAKAQEVDAVMRHTGCAKQLAVGLEHLRRCARLWFWMRGHTT